MTDKRVGGGQQSGEHTARPRMSIIQSINQQTFPATVDLTTGPKTRETQTKVRSTWLKDLLNWAQGLFQPRPRSGSPFLSRPTTSFFLSARTELVIHTHVVQLL